MRHFLRLLSYLLLLPLLAFVLYFNVKLYHQPRFEAVPVSDAAAGSEARLNADLRAQLDFLQKALAEDAAAEMQAAYPEGGYWLLALYGLAACDLAEAAPEASPAFEAAMAHVERAQTWLDSSAMRDLFVADQPLPYGAFYHGWTHYLLGRKLASLPADRRKAEEVRRFRRACQQVASVWRQTEQPFLSIQPGAARPVDGMPCAAAVALYEQLYPGSFAEDLEWWRGAVAAQLDTLGLIPHRVDPATGAALQTAQGNSQGLTLIFLADLAPKLAQQQFQRYYEQFVVKFLGLVAVRQHPRGFEGESGPAPAPLVFGLSSTASLVAMRTLAQYGAESEALALRNSAEALGLGLTWGGKKRYLLGQWPLLDAGLAWLHAQEAGADQRLATTSNWRFPFQAVSVPVGVLLLLLLMGLHHATRRPRPKPPKSSPPSRRPKAEKPTDDTDYPSGPPRWHMPDQA